MGRTESIEALEGEISNFVRRLRRVIAERAHAVHPDLHVGPYWIFASIARCEPVRASSIAEEQALDKGAVSRQVQHLISLGLVERRRDPADGRAQLLQVTPAGRRRLEAVNADRWNSFTQRLSDWTTTDIDELTHALGRYNAVIAPEEPEEPSTP